MKRWSCMNTSSSSLSSSTSLDENEWNNDQKVNCWIYWLIFCWRSMCRRVRDTILANKFLQQNHEYSIWHSWHYFPWHEWTNSGHGKGTLRKFWNSLAFQKNERGGERWLGGDKKLSRMQILEFWNNQMKARRKIVLNECLSVLGRFFLEECEWVSSDKILISQKQSSCQTSWTWHILLSSSIHFYVFLSLSHIFANNNATTS